MADDKDDNKPERKHTKKGALSGKYLPDSAKYRAAEIIKNGHIEREDERVQLQSSIVRRTTAALMMEAEDLDLHPVELLNVMNSLVFSIITNISKEGRLIPAIRQFIESMAEACDTAEAMMVAGYNPITGEKFPEDSAPLNADPTDDEGNGDGEPTADATAEPQNADNIVSFAAHVPRTLH